MPYGIIYRAFDKTNGKSYVGQTVQTLEQRRNAHHSPKSGCHKFRSALLKRTDAFEWSILCECENEIELNSAEEKWVRELDAVVNG